MEDTAFWGGRLGDGVYHITFRASAPACRGIVGRCARLARRRECRVSTLLRTGGNVDRVTEVVNYRGSAIDQRVEQGVKRENCHPGRTRQLTGTHGIIGDSRVDHFN